jgi:hypothetical protein
METIISRNLEEAIVEFPLLLPDWQMSALEQAANFHGMTAGEMVRHIISQYFGQISLGRSFDPPGYRIKAV